MQGAGRCHGASVRKSGTDSAGNTATFSSTGTPSIFLHAADALHGDLGALTAEDVMLAISTSGETEEIVEILESVKRMGIRLLAPAKTRSSLASASDVVLDIAVKEEACSLNLAPTASTAAALAMGDALAISLLDRRGFKEEDFAALHPGGRLGKKLRRVKVAEMHAVHKAPHVLPTAKMPDVIYEMSRKGLGLTAITEANGKLLGLITDGDLRRVMQKRQHDVLDSDCRRLHDSEPGHFVSHRAGRDRCV